jgi:hypothetical protein
MNSTPANVVHFDDAKRLRALVENWRHYPMADTCRRFTELCAEQRRGTTIPNDVYEAWLQMSAYLTIAGMRA